MHRVLDEEGRKKFIYHPILMSVGIVGIPLAAILQQRLYGYTSKKIHMYSMIVSLVVSLTGAYIIISEKSDSNESHFKSAHAMAGLVWCIFAIFQSIFGMIAVDPDLKVSLFRPEHGRDNIRRFISAKSIHSTAGRAIVILGYLVMFSGWLKFFRDDTLRSALFGASMFALAACALFDPINDYVSYRRLLSSDDAPDRSESKSEHSD